MIIDDWHLPGCRMAVLDYRAHFGITDPIYEHDANAYWTKRERPFAGAGLSCSAVRPGLLAFDYHCAIAHIRLRAAACSDARFCVARGFA